MDFNLLPLVKSMIIRIIDNQYNRLRINVTPRTMLRSGLRMSEDDLVSLTHNLRAEFNVVIENDEFELVDSVDEVIDLISAKLSLGLRT